MFTLGDTDKKAEYVKNMDYLIDAIAKLKHAGDVFNRRLDFKVDKDTNRIIVKVIDTKTDKVIKEIPPEQLIELAAKIQEMVGLLIDEERRDILKVNSASGGRFSSQVLYSEDSIWPILTFPGFHQVI